MLDSVAFGGFANIRGGVSLLLFLVLAGSAIQLVPDGTILLHLLLIVVMVVVLDLTLLRPINRVLADRELRTKGRVEEAERVLANVRERFQLYDSTLREARAQGYALLESEREQIAREREQKVKESKQELAQWIQEEQGKLDSEVAQVKSALQLEAEKTAESIVRHILRREISTSPSRG
jgi:F0F1-type ATP synthase membrane subunit b/b'